MRIRLLIERNELPSVSVLWSFTSTQLSFTVAQFLENVNMRFPLEGNTWGLEDYTVSLAGYEAQHYTKVGEIFKEDDEVVIKPLLFAEARARTISGRAQIAADGRRLVDGVPFGKPLLKRVRRPEVNIPPARKRARLLEQEENAAAVVRFEEREAEDAEDEDDEEDGDFEDSGDDELDEDDEDANPRTQDRNTEDDEDSDDSDISSDSSGSGEDTGTGQEETGPGQDDRGPCQVEMGPGQEDIGPDLDRSSDESANTSDSDTSSEASSSDSEEQDASESESESEESEDSDSSSDSSGSDTIEGIKPTAPTPAQDTPLPIPHEGKLRTKERNIRRREAARLKHLKQAGVVPPNSTIAEMYLFLKTGGIPPSTLEQTARDYDGPKKIPSRTAGPVMVDSTTGALTRSSAEPESKVRRHSYRTAAQAVMPDASNRLTPAERAIWSSLGLKAPKTIAEKEALRQKLADRSRQPVPQVAPVAPVQQPPPPPNWFNTLDIRAVECGHPGVTLSAPPFPFRQKWDPQYWTKRQKRDHEGGEGQSNGRKRRGMHAGGHVVETYDKYNQNGGSDALDYDDEGNGDWEDEEEEWNDGEDWQEGALLGAEDQEQTDDRFPALPADTSSLPALAEGDAKAGDFVVFSEMACSEATRWEPRTVTTVARLASKVASEVGSGWNVEFSGRGARKQYDREGNRVYGKFEMVDYEDQAEEDKQMVWAEMTDIKLLLRSN